MPSHPGEESKRFIVHACHHSDHNLSFQLRTPTHAPLLYWRPRPPIQPLGRPQPALPRGDVTTPSRRQFFSIVVNATLTKKWRDHFPAKLARFLSATPKPFSGSSGRIRGVGGTSSSLTRPARPLDSLTDLGNSVRRGVNAVTTFLADLRIVSRTFHSLFFATKKRTDEETPALVSFRHGNGSNPCTTYSLSRRQHRRRL